MGKATLWVKYFVLFGLDSGSKWTSSKTENAYNFRYALGHKVIYDWSHGYWVWLCNGLYLSVSKSYDLSVFSPSCTLRCEYQLGGTFDSACLSSIIVNGWVYSHTSKWFSWLVCFPDNDGSGLVRIRHVSDWALVVCLPLDWARLPRRWGHQCAEPDRRFCKFSMGLKWHIFIANKQESSLPRLVIV